MYNAQTDGVEAISDLKLIGCFIDDDRISPDEFRVLRALAWYSNETLTKEVFPSIATLQEKLKIKSDTTVLKHIRSLTEKGFILLSGKQVIARGYVNKYQFTDRTVTELKSFTEVFSGVISKEYLRYMKNMLLHTDQNLDNPAISSEDAETNLEHNMGTNHNIINNDLTNQSLSTKAKANTNTSYSSTGQPVSSTKISIEPLRVSEISRHSSPSFSIDPLGQFFENSNQQPTTNQTSQVSTNSGAKTENFDNSSKPKKTEKVPAKKKNMWQLSKEHIHDARNGTISWDAVRDRDFAIYFINYHNKVFKLPTSFDRYETVGAIRDHLFPHTHLTRDLYCDFIEAYIDVAHSIPGHPDTITPGVIKNYYSFRSDVIPQAVELVKRRKKQREVKNSLEPNQPPRVF